MLMLGGQIDVTDDGYLSLMEESGNIREDIKAPEGEVGDKLSKLREDGKDLSECSSLLLRIL